MRSRDSRWLGILVAAATLAALAGCNDNQLGMEKRRPNQPPQTILSSGPPDSTYGTNYRVHLFWSGSDPDGTIDHYDFILIDHPASDDSIATGSPDAANQVVVRLPLPDDPRWTSTVANDTIVVTKADTLRHAPPIRETQNDSLRQMSFERWHTFFVRAVDNEGLADQSPEYLSFNSQTLAPDVSLKPPVNPLRSDFSGPRVIVFNWQGSDPVGDGTTIEPIASRWVIFPTRNIGGVYQGFPDTLYSSAMPWKPWRRWDARDKSGVQAIVKDLIPIEHGGGFYLFAVQAMDEAGAVTPVFDASTAGKNNAVKIFVNDQVGATLTVTEKFLGTFNFAGATRPVQLDIAAGQPISFRLRGDASSYGGEIVAYRYGWNIRNPSDDTEWEQNWCETCRTAPTRVFNSGTQRFFAECRDNAETVTHAEFELVVRQVTRTRDLLFVDDTYYSPGDGTSEDREDRRWTTVLDSVLARRAFNFDRLRDTYDVEAHQNFPPPLSLVFDYKTIVWTSRALTAPNAIKSLAFFFDPFAPQNQNATPKFNYLNIYIENHGEFWLSGEQQSSNLWPTSNVPYPVNLTNWDEPEPVHPDIDSVGVTGFLWKMGVEAVDIGAGSRAPVPRYDTPVHGCLGFRRAVAEDSVETYTSSSSADHRHDLELPTRDVETPPVDGKTYTTTLSAEHTHTVTLTAEQLHALARGDTVGVTTSESAIPRTHVHTFHLVDKVGLWGAPAALEKDDSSWPNPPSAIVNPYKGRYNIEMFNMPSFMARQQPPLSPQPGISLVLYNYISVTPEDPNANPPRLYPNTADNQPSVLLRKAQITEPYYSRAICAFEMWRLRFGSHLALASYILLRHFRLGLPDS